MSDAEARVSKLIGQWREAGSTPQGAFDWSKSSANWTRDIPQMKKFIESLPRSLDRTFLRETAKNQDFSAVEKFTATMIWGYGDVGYGSYRVKKMFNSLDFVRKIENSFSMCQSNEPLAAYSYLSKNRIEQLGPAFGTKWIAFVTPTGSPAPIYDSLIGTWFSTFAAADFEGVSLNPEVWSLKTYTSYVLWMSKVAEKHSIKCDDLELVLFQEASKLFSKKVN
jgi:hypothetical protein